MVGGIRCHACGQHSDSWFGELEEGGGMSGSLRAGREAAQLVLQEDESVCVFLLADHPLRMHISIHSLSFSLYPSSLCLRQSDCARCLCLRVRIWYLKPRPPAPPPSLLMQTPAGSRVCLGSLLPPTDHNIHYCILSTHSRLFAYYNGVSQPPSTLSFSST